MKYGKNKKHPILFLTAALLACQPVSAMAAVTFADLNQVPWAGAETSIQKAADLGLIVGETVNGKSYFRPKNAVTLCETAQLAYKVLINTGKAQADGSLTEKWSTVMSTYQIPSWAYTAVSFCLENNIVSISDLGTYMKNGTTAAATREQAAEILGRALTAGASSYQATSTSTKFADNSSIESGALPYVALLNQAGVVNGDDANKFNPKNTLNRTETAVLVTNLYTVLSNASGGTRGDATTSGQTLKGTVGSITNFYLNFADSSSYYYFPMNATPSVTLNGSSSTLSDVVALYKNGAALEASITLNADGRIGSMTVTSDKKSSSDPLTGEVTSLSKNRIKIGDNYYDIYDPDEVSVKIDSSSSKDFDDLLDLYKEDKKTIEATVTLDRDNYVTRIVATTSSGSAKSGELTSLKEVKNKDDYEATMKVGSKTYYIEDTSKLSVKIDSSSSKDFDDLMDLYEGGKTIEVTVTADKDDFVSKVVATTKSSSGSTKTGELTSVKEVKNEDDYEGTIKVDKKTYYIEDIDDVDVKIDKKSVDFDDLIDAFKDLDDDETYSVTVTLDKNDSDYVTKIVATLEDEEDSKKGELKKLSTSSMTVGSTKYNIDDEDDLDIDIDDGDETIKDWDDFKEAFDDGKVMQVTVTVKSGDVTKVTGEVTEVKGVLYDCSSSSIKVEVDSGKYTYDFADDADEIDVDFTGDNSVDTLADFLDDYDEDDWEDDDLIVTLTLKDGEVTEFEAEWD